MLLHIICVNCRRWAPHLPDEMCTKCLRECLKLLINYFLYCSAQLILGPHEITSIIWEFHSYIICLSYEASQCFSLCAALHFIYSPISFDFTTQQQHVSSNMWMVKVQITCGLRGLQSFVQFPLHGVCDTEHIWISSFLLNIICHLIAWLA